MAFQSTRKVTPRTDISGLYVADTGDAGTVTAVVVPEGALGVTLWFEDGSGKVRGRIGFADNDRSGTGDSSLATITDGDSTLGYQSDFPDTYSIVKWGAYLHVASDTANAVVLGCWHYAG